MTEIQDLLAKLISFPSITPDDAGCQEFMIHFLEQLGFDCLRCNQDPVANFFARYGKQGPLVVFAGHTDVVPVGDATLWHTDPFLLTACNDLLYGRGVADMKGSLACMLAMAQRWLTTYPAFEGSLGFLITSGEEGDDFDLGTPYLMQQLEQRGISIDYCVLGEPSSTQHVGDVIKIGRRGSLTAKIQVQGKQGHVAYPHLADNPIHKVSPALLALTTTVWDNGNAYFPPTTMQITGIRAGGTSGNVIPSALDMDLNFRFSTQHTAESLQAQVVAIFEAHHTHPTITWRLNGQPFITKEGVLLQAAKEVIFKETGTYPELSTSGGTSDGRFIAPYGIQLIELGPVNASIHQVNECVRLDDLLTLERIYFALCESLFRV